MEHINLTRKPHRRVSDKIRERIGKVKYHIETLNDKEELGKGHVYTLGHIGKNRRLCLRKDGDIQAIGLLAIEEYLWAIRYFQASGEAEDFEL